VAALQRRAAELRASLERLSAGGGGGGGGGGAGTERAQLREKYAALSEDELLALRVGLVAQEKQAGECANGVASRACRR
jgi:hypothetical protein